MKKKLVAIVLVISFIVSIPPILALRIRCVEVFQNIILQQEQAVEEEVEEQITDSSSQTGLLARLYHYYWLYLTIDHSAVTPIILIWFFFSIVWYSIKFLRTNKITLENEKFTSAETFPFYKNYETIWVQLGFIGTLWGFFMIGWSMGLNDPTAGIQDVEVLTILMRAFGTALVSTLTAVVLVYVVTLPVKAFFCWAMDIPSEDALPLSDEILEEFTLFINNLEKSNELVNNFNKMFDKSDIVLSLTSITEHIKEIKDTLRKIQEDGKFDKLFVAVGNLENKSKLLREDSQNIHHDSQKILEKLTGFVEHFSKIFINR